MAVDAIHYHKMAVICLVMTAGVVPSTELPSFHFIVEQPRHVHGCKGPSTNAWLDEEKTRLHHFIFFC